MSAIDRRIGSGFALAEAIKVLVAAGHQSAASLLLDEWKRIEDAGVAAKLKENAA